MNYKKVVIKIGTHVLTREDGSLNKEIISKLVEQIAQLTKNGIQIVLVSSGAVGAANILKKKLGKVNDIVKRQILASVGQVSLISLYADEFKKHGYECGQVLATKEDFRDRKHYLNMKNCFDALLKESIIPIANENDVVSVDELMFTDNDELAGLIASMIGVDALIMLTIKEGVLDGKGKVIQIINNEEEIKDCISPDVSKIGKGGMITKCKTACKMASLGITTHIASGYKASIIDIINGEQVGTVFPKQKYISNVKKWIAHTQGQEKGVVYINKGAEERLREKGKAASLLPIGVNKIQGDFEKGDRHCQNQGRG